MEFNLRTPALEMNKKENKWSIRRSELSIGSWNSAECQMTGLLLVVCSMTLARRLQVRVLQSWSSNVEPGDRRLLPSGVENESVLYWAVNVYAW